jgi:hypothetical protein
MSKAESSPLCLFLAFPFTSSLLTVKNLSSSTFWECQYELNAIALCLYSSRHNFSSINE